MPRFVPRERKHKRLAKLKEQPKGDSNALEIASSSEVAKPSEDSRFAQIPRVSTKKRKRLEKYLSTKLKKDENVRLLAKLAEQNVDTSLFRSSKKLGRGQDETRREELTRALNERKAGVSGAEDVLFDRRRETEASDNGSGEGGEEEEEAAGLAVKKPLTEEEGTAQAFGGGLKRPLDVDQQGRPVIRKRRRRNRPADEPMLLAQFEPESPPGSDDESFESVENPEYMDGHASPLQSCAMDNEEERSSKEAEWAGFGESDEGNNAPEDDEESSDVSFSTDHSNEDKPTRLSAFKSWADAQRNATVDFTPSALPETDATIKAAFTPRAPSPDPGDRSLFTTPSHSSTAIRPFTSLAIEREPEVQEARLNLPVVQEEHRILEAVHAHPIVILCGATGSGKTTQVPQMLLENGYGSMIGQHPAGVSTSPQSRGLIAVTQPRRVAATSVAARVAYELGPNHRKRVAHQVRYDSNVSPQTAIKYMTDGILLREIQSDFTLRKYSVVVIDEVHERGLNTDILIGLLSRIVPLREELTKEKPDEFHPLKVVIMSATLRINEFLQNSRLFKDIIPPVVEVEGRQFTVTDHFARRTKRDYVTEMIDKVARGHRKLPTGAMLVFLTGREEIQTVSRGLRDRLGGAVMQTRDDIFDFNGKTRGEDGIYFEEPEDDSDGSSSASIKLDDDDEFAIPSDQIPFSRSMTSVPKPHILPLYAALPADQQQKVFQPPPEGHRLIVLATNVAETSLTIPGIRYVFDSGRSKEKKYDLATGIQTFEIGFISKASAEQRKGRAGRTGPGHCYKLYSSAVYENQFHEYDDPEILRTPMENVVLQLKGMNVDNVVDFPFLTPPPSIQMESAEALLRNLGAVDERSGLITDTGKDLARYPLSPRFGKMLILAKRNAQAKPKTTEELARMVEAVVSGLAVGDVYISETHASFDDEDDDSNPQDGAEFSKFHQEFHRAQATLARWDDTSDTVKLLTAIAAHSQAAKASSLTGGGATKFCQKFFLREKAMSEVQRLRVQLQNISDATSDLHSSTVRSDAGKKLPLPSTAEMAMLNQIVAAGFLDQVAIRADLLQDRVSGFGRKPKRATEIPYQPLFPLATTDDSKTLSPVEQEIERSVFIHPSSVLAKLSVSEAPKYIVYSHLSRSAVSHVSTDGREKSKKTRMHALSPIGPKVLAALAEGTPLLEFGKPIGKIEDLGGGTRECWISVSLRAPGGASESWPLGAWKVMQQKGSKGEWTVERIIAR